MPSFIDAMNAARLRKDDKTSGARLKEILSILRAHDVREGLTPEKAVAVLEDLGPTFVKLGQIASAHPDILPKEYCDAFAQLRTHVAPMDAVVVRQRVEEELGRPIDEVFSAFDDHALGSASVAQVHRATLREEGREVAVKVQRPHVKETVASDLTLMHRILSAYEFIDPGDGNISFRELVEELERTSREELDFTNEERNLQRFAHNNEARERISCPAVYPRYSTDSLLVEDFASGPCASDAERAGLTQDERDGLARLIAQNYMQQLLDDGFFHADPHAGNILLTGTDAPRREDGARELGVEWIDFGMMGELSGLERTQIRRIVVAVGKRDPYGLMRAVLQLARPTRPVDHAELLAQCDSVLQSYAVADLESFDMAGVLDAFTDMMRAGGYELPPAVTMLARGLVTLEGTIRDLSGSVNIMGVLAAYLSDDFDPQQVAQSARDLLFTSADSAKSLTSLPTRAVETLDMLQKGQVKVETHLGADEEFRREARDIARYATYAIMATGLFMGSCVLCLTSLEPRILGVPLLGLIGFACGLLLALYDLWNIYRDNRRRR